MVACSSGEVMIVLHMIKTNGSSSSTISRKSVVGDGSRLHYHINICAIEIRWDGKQLKYQLITRWGMAIDDTKRFFFGGGANHPWGNRLWAKCPCDTSCETSLGRNVGLQWAKRIISAGTNRIFMLAQSLSSRCTNFSLHPTPTFASLFTPTCCYGNSLFIFSFLFLFLLLTKHTSKKYACTIEDINIW